MFKLFSRFALFLKRRSYIQRLIGILLHLHRADFDTYAFFNAFIFASTPPLAGFTVLILFPPSTVYSLSLLKSLAAKFYAVHWRLPGLR